MNVYESQFLVNTFNAVNADTGEVITADAAGFISPSAGTTIIFPNPNVGAASRNKYADVNTVLFTTRASAVKVVVNDNEMYPFYVPPNTTKGLQYIRVYKIKVLSGTDFCVEGLSNET